MYRVRVHKLSLEHKGGTKAYHLLRISLSDKSSLVVNRWGKLGSFGETSHETFPTSILADKAFYKKKREKEGRGYGLRHEDDEWNGDVFSVASMDEVLGGATIIDLRRKSPEFYDEMMKEMERVEAQERGDTVIDEYAEVQKNIWDEGVGTLAEAGVKVPTKTYADDDRWGSF